LLAAKISAKQLAELKMPILSREIGRDGEKGGLGIFYKREILDAPAAIPRSAPRCWRGSTTGSDKRRSVQSRRATGLRRPLRKTPFGLEWQRMHPASAVVARISARPLTSAHDE
jgi:hypothetical protein